MSCKVEKPTLLPGNGTLLGHLESDGHQNDWDEWEDFEPGPICEELWDVFALDDETAEPEPEPGDFWGQVDDEEPI